MLLVDADSVCPYDPLNEGIPEARQGRVETRRDWQLAVVDAHKARVLAAAPYVAQRFERVASLLRHQDGTIEEAAMNGRVLVQVGEQSEQADVAAGEG